MDGRPAAAPDPYRYCPICGDGLPGGGPGGRRHCPDCGWVRYRNPIAGVAVVVRDRDGRVLLGRRARGEYAGLWCIPCGYVEWDEDVREAAGREFAEETGLGVSVGAVLAVHSNFHNQSQHTVGIWFAGAVTGSHAGGPDGELSEMGYFDPAAPPALAFATDAIVLRSLAGGL